MGKVSRAPSILPQKETLMEVTSTFVPKPSAGFDLTATAPVVAR